MDEKDEEDDADKEEDADAEDDDDDDDPFNGFAPVPNILPSQLMEVESMCYHIFTSLVFWNSFLRC